jgi:hypothetical protein
MSATDFDRIHRSRGQFREIWPSRKWGRPKTAPASRSIDYAQGAVASGPISRANQLGVHAVEIAVSLVAELVPKLIGGRLATRLHDGLV